MPAFDAAQDATHNLNGRPPTGCQAAAARAVPGHGNARQRLGATTPVTAYADHMAEPFGCPERSIGAPNIDLPMIIPLGLARRWDPSARSPDSPPERFAVV